MRASVAIWHLNTVFHLQVTKEMQWTLALGGRLFSVQTKMLQLTIEEPLLPGWESWLRG